MTSVVGGRQRSVVFSSSSVSAPPRVVQELLGVDGNQTSKRNDIASRVWRPRALPVGGVPKRCIDVVASLALIIALAPIMLMVAGLIRLCLGGRVIFSQPRIGFGGKRFTCYKFRSMVLNADEVLERHLASSPGAAREWRETRKLRKDPRVGCLGNILRKSSLDELPQLFNVLRGDMSLVGPRPVVPEELANYGRYAQDYRDTRPGITGLWQTSGRNRLSYRARVARDYYYARHWSLWLDVALLLKTIPAILSFGDTA